MWSALLAFLGLAVHCHYFLSPQNDSRNDKRPHPSRAGQICLANCIDLLHLLIHHEKETKTAIQRSSIGAKPSLANWTCRAAIP
mmetsp:Transcript_22136/g.31708  ORF Transcript_22136/g.31708 Transcript_22136/m.31708 type:complete len:84 (+) Transcript_22136:197-448(+)